MCQLGHKVSELVSRCTVANSCSITWKLWVTISGPNVHQGNCMLHSDFLSKSSSSTITHLILTRIENCTWSIMSACNFVWGRLMTSNYSVHFYISDVALLVTKNRCWKLEADNFIVFFVGPFLWSVVYS